MEGASFSRKPSLAVSQATAQVQSSSNSNMITSASDKEKSGLASSPPKAPSLKLPLSQSYEQAAVRTSMLVQDSSAQVSPKFKAKPQVRSIVSRKSDTEPTCEVDLSLEDFHTPPQHSPSQALLTPETFCSARPDSDLEVEPFHTDEDGTLLVHSMDSLGLQTEDLSADIRSELAEGDEKSTPFVPLEEVEHRMETQMNEKLTKVLTSPGDIISEDAIEETMRHIQQGNESDTGIGPGRIRKHADEGDYIFHTLQERTI